MSKTLDSITFGDKLYKSLPEIYRAEDAEVNFALKRYLQALSEGGFTKVIEETNKILSLVDPERVDAKILPVLFKSYGLEMFNGVPEMYLRKLLPMVSELFSLKGSITSVEYLTALISGVKSSIKVSEAFKVDHAVDVILEMDYGTEQSKELPDREQLLRIIKEFVPFFCNVTIIYSYFFNEEARVFIQDSYYSDYVTYTSGEQTVIHSNDTEVARVVREAISDTGILKPNESIKDVIDFLHTDLASVKYIDDLISDIQTAVQESGALKTVDTELQTVKITTEDSFTTRMTDFNSLIGDASSVLNSTFILNNISSYDIIKKTGKEDSVLFT